MVSSKQTMLLTLAVFVIFAPWQTEAVTWSVKTITNSTILDASDRNDVNPYSDEAQNCTSPGTCIPWKVKMNLQQAFSWCGWKTTYRSLYKVNVVNKSTDANFSAFLMRQKDLNTCIYEYGLAFKQCQIIAFSTCDTVSSCTLQPTGLAFSDDLCFMLAVNGNLTVNKNRTGSNITFQFYNYYDSPVYYGSIFSIIFTIFASLAMLIYLGQLFYFGYTLPHDRLHELRTLEAKMAEKEAAANKGEDLADETTGEDRRSAFQDRVRNAMSRVRRTLRRSDIN